MRISELAVENFRLIDRLFLNLHPDFNVLVGENGAGKTTILEALTVAIGSWFLGIGGIESRPIRSEDVRLAGRRVGDETVFEPQYPVGISVAGFLSDKPVSWTRVLLKEGGRTSQSEASDLKELAIEAERRVRTFDPVTLPLIVYYGAGRLWLPTRNTDGSSGITKRDLSRLVGYRDALNARASSRELNRWLEYQDRIAYQEKHESPLYRSVLDTMCNMVEEAANVRFDAKRLEVVVEFKDGVVRPFGQLSDGQRSMIALAGDMAMRAARLNPHFGLDAVKETPGVVLIDELDLHLHPHWQRHVAADLRRTFPNIQFVTTTHSPQIISEVQPESVTILSREDEKIVAYKAHQTYGLDTNGVLQRLMDDPGRPVPALEKIDAVDDAIEEGELEQARGLVEDLRRMLHGDDPEVARLEASINNLEALALDAVD